MKVGFTSMNTPEEIAPDLLAGELESRGYDSLWIGEHSHIPASRATPYPAGGELPAPYLRMMDPYVALTAAAGSTKTLLLGLGVTLPLERDIFALAKTAATLDVLSGGRLQFGVGVGWNQEELANVRPDIAWPMRYRALEECVAALRTLWTEDDAGHSGEFFAFDPVWSFPKPAQQPHLPVLCGTGGKLGTEHAVRWSDGWMPMDVALGSIESGAIAKKVAYFRSATEDTGRGHVPITMVVFGDPTIEALEHYRDIGVDRVVLGGSRTGWDDPSTTMPFIDRWADVIDGLA